MLFVFAEQAFLSESQLSDRQWHMAYTCRGMTKPIKQRRICPNQPSPSFACLPACLPTQLVQSRFNAIWQPVTRLRPINCLLVYRAHYLGRIFSHVRIYLSVWLSGCLALKLAIRHSPFPVRRSSFAFHRLPRRVDKHTPFSHWTCLAIE